MRPCRGVELKQPHAHAAGGVRPVPGVRAGRARRRAGPDTVLFSHQLKLNVESFVPIVTPFIINISFNHESYPFPLGLKTSSAQDPQVKLGKWTSVPGKALPWRAPGVSSPGWAPHARPSRRDPR